MGSGRLGCFSFPGFNAKGWGSGPSILGLQFGVQGLGVRSSGLRGFRAQAFSARCLGFSVRSYGMKRMLPSSPLSFAVRQYLHMMLLGAVWNPKESGLKMTRNLKFAATTPSSHKLSPSCRSVIMIPLTQSQAAG